MARLAQHRSGGHNSLDPSVCNVHVDRRLERQHVAGLRTLFRSLFWQSRHVEAGSVQLAHLIKSVERNPHQDVEYIELLQAYESKGDLDSAIAYLTKFVERKRNAETPYRFLLVAYNKKGDLAGLRNVIRLRPKYVAAHEWFLTAAYINGDWDAAIAVLSALVELHPKGGAILWRQPTITKAKLVRSPRPFPVPQPLTPARLPTGTRVSSKRIWSLSRSSPRLRSKTESGRKSNTHYDLGPDRLPLGRSSKA
jgi:tetratricopeptide (TPR) repeat protein